MDVQAKIQAMHDKVAATKDLVPRENIDRMKVLWTKGRNMFASFFTEIDTTRRQINNDELFASWCFFQLRIGMEIINDMTIVLKHDDAARVRDDLKGAVKVDKERRSAEAHVEKLAKIARENELAELRARNVEAKAAKEQAAAKAKSDAIKAANKQRRKEKAEREGGAVSRAKAAIMAAPAAKRDEICALADVSHGVEKEARAVLEAEGKVAPRAEAKSETALYEQYVADGKTAAGFQWKLGDLAVKVSRLKVHGEATLERYASDVGVEYSTLRGYKAVAEAWPEVVARATNWTVARILTTHPDRVAIVAADPYMTAEKASEIMRAWKAETNVVNLRQVPA
jgi:hypothetical protein